MAVYKRDIADINLETGNIHRTFLNHSIGMKDQKADHFGVRVFRDGEPVNLTGVSVQGVFMPPQGSPIAITSGNIVSGNVAEVVLPQACYNYDGQFCLAIKLVDATNSVTGTVRIVDGMVDNTHASGTVAPTSAVPTYQEVLSVYEQAIAAISTVNAMAGKMAVDITAGAESTSNNSFKDLGNRWMTFRRGYYSTPAVGSTSSYTDDVNYVYALVACAPGDVLHAHGYGDGTSKSAWAFLDSSLKILDKGGSGNYEGATDPAPTSTAFALVNVKLASLGSGYYGWTGPEAIKDQIATLKDAVSEDGNIIYSRDLKSALVKNNSYIIADKGASASSGGMNFEWTGNACYVHGSASSTKFNDIYGSTTELLYPFEKGKTYRLKMDSTTNKVGLQAYCWGATNRSLITTFTDASFTIPDDAIGIGIRLRVEANTSVDETVHPSVETGADTNMELTEHIKYVLNLNSNYITGVQSGDDLDDYTTPGNYKVQANATAENVDNIPYEGAGELIVLATTALTRLVQLYIVNSTSFMVYYRFYSGSWSEWIRLTSMDDATILAKIGMETERDVSPYTNNAVQFTVSGTSISFSVTRVIAHWKDSDGKMKEKVFLTESPYTVPHDSFAIFNLEDEEIQVKTLAQLKVLSDTNYITMFYNSSGNVAGAWRVYWLQEKVNNIANNNSGVPDYYVSHIDTKANQINLQLAELQPQNPTIDVKTKGSAFVFISDIHYNKNEMHSPSLVGAISNLTGITTIQVNGDQITKEVNKQTALTKINKINSLYLYPEKETYFTVGNHEWNNPSLQEPDIQLEDYEMWYAFINPIRKRAVFDTKTVSYYYDDTDAKIRYLVGEVTRGSSIHGDSAKWIAAKIAEAPEGYGIVVIMHTILKYTESEGVYTPAIQDTLGATILIGAIDAVRAGTNFTYQGVTYEYANKNYEMIGAFCGDTHVDLFMRTPGGVPIICTTTDSKDEEGTIDRTVGTSNEQAFDVIVINRETKKIHCNRIGGGSDRLDIDFVEQS